MIKVDNLKKTYNKRRNNEIKAINSVSLTLPKRGLVAILGDSGSGKTTLLNAISGLDRVDFGMISIDNVEFKRYKSSQWDKIRREEIGYIFQNYSLLPHLTVYENVAYVLKINGISDEKTIEYHVNYVLKAVGLFKYRKKIVDHLSGGQKQRVGIARALVKNPKILIADEPTGNLDSKNTIAVMNIIRKLANQILVVLVTHERNHASNYADRIITITDGEVQTDVLNIPKIASDYDPDVIFLNEYTNSFNLSNDQIDLKIVTDEKESAAKKMKLKLVTVNNTTYLQPEIDDALNYELLDDYSATKLIEEKANYQPNVVDFDFEIIKKIDREMSNIDKSTSFKNSLKTAFMNTFFTNKKRLLLYFGFILLGLFGAFGISSFNWAISVGYADSKILDPNYVRVTNQNFDFDTIMSKPQVNIDDPIILRNFMPLNFRFKSYLTGGYESVRFNTTIDSSRNILEKSLLYRSNDYLENSELRFGETIIDLTYAENLLSQLDSYGIRDYEALLDNTLTRTIYVDDLPYYQILKIVGIVNNGQKAIYVNNNQLQNLQVLRTSWFLPDFVNYDMIDGQDIENASITSSDFRKIMVTKDYYHRVVMGLTENDQYLFVENTQHTRNKITYEIIGVFKQNSLFAPAGFEDFQSTEQGLPIIISNRYAMNEFHIRNAVDGQYIYIYSDDPTLTVNSFDNNAAVVYSKYLQDSAKRSNDQLILVTTILSAGFLLLTAFGFYFITRSSLVSRTYEIGVKRSLGIKKSSVFLLFILEILILTVITTIIGYFIGSYLVFATKGTFMELIFLVKIDALSFVLGFLSIFGINLVVGLLPIIVLLAKTPVEIQAKYDL